MLTGIFFWVAAVANAQIFQSPFPMKESDFAAIRSEKVAGCTVYKMFEDYQGALDSVPVLAVEYGAGGLPAVRYEIGLDDSEAWDTTSIAYFTFDARGRLWSEVIDEQDNDEMHILYTYNKKGQLIKKEVATVDPPTFEYRYKGKRLVEIFVTVKMPLYDEHGDFKGKTIDRPTYRYIPVFDESGRLVSLKGFLLYGEDGPGEVYSLKTWAYDPQGRMAVIREYQTDAETLDFESRLYYDKNGLLNRYEEQWPDETLSYHVHYCRDCVPSWMRH